jgi:hypothetical protein
MSWPRIERRFRRPLLVVAAAWLVSRILYSTAGVDFDGTTYLWYWQFIDPALLKTNGRFRIRVDALVVVLSFPLLWESISAARPRVRWRPITRQAGPARHLLTPSRSSVLEILLPG